MLFCYPHRQPVNRQIDLPTNDPIYIRNTFFQSLLELNMNLKTSKQILGRQKTSIIRLLLSSSPNILLIQFHNYVKAHWMAMFLHSITVAPSVLACENALITSMRLIKHLFSHLAWSCESCKSENQLYETNSKKRNKPTCSKLVE